MTLLQAYKKKRYATGGGMNDALEGVTATEKPGIMQGVGLAASLGSGIIDATAKPDPLSGRISTGATVGKGALSGAAMGAQFGPLGALAGGVIGGGLGLIKGLKEKKEARQMLAGDARDKYQDDASRSGALLATNPELLTGYKNSGYYAMGGDMTGGGEGGGDPEPPKTRKLTPAEMAQWNQFLDHVKAKGYEGSADLNVKNKNLGASLFADWKKANPNATINYDIVPSVQQEMQNLKTSAQGFAQRRGQANADQIMAGVSPVDGWFGSKTSQFRFPGMTTMSTTNGVITDHRNLGLVNANIAPVGINADGTANNGQTQVGQTVAQMLNLPQTRPWQPGQVDIYGKPVPKDAKIELGSDGKYYFEDPHEGMLRQVKLAHGGMIMRKKERENLFDPSSPENMASGGTIHIKPENRGKFNATKARTGKTTEELTHSSNPVTRKRAIFAQNAAKWNHATGGPIEAPLSQMYMKGGYAKSLSSDNTEMVGNSHANGGIDIGGTGVELEGNETTAGNFVFSDQLGFAEIHKKIAKAKGKIEKKPPTFERVNSMKLLNAREQNLALMQEYIKRQQGIA